MYRAVVLTDPELATGFRLAGIEVVEASSADEARKSLRTLLDGDYGLIILNDEFMAGIDRETARLMNERAVPVVVPFPGQRLRKEKEAENYVADLVRSCIGYSIKLR